MLCDSDPAYENIWYTIGGAGTNVTLDETLITTALNYAKGVNGICFDIEASLNLEQVREWMSKYKDQAKKQGLTTLVATIEVGALDTPKPEDGFDYVSVMLYTGNKSYPNYDPFHSTVRNNTYWKLNSLLKNGYTADKIILTYQSYSAYDYDGVDKMLQTMAKACTSSDDVTISPDWNIPKPVIKGPFAGILAWPAQEDKKPCQAYKDLANTNIILKALNKDPVDSTDDCNLSNCFNTPASAGLADSDSEYHCVCNEGYSGTPCTPSTPIDGSCPQGSYMQKDTDTCTSLPPGCGW